MVRQYFQGIIASEPGYRIIGMAGDLAGADALLDQSPDLFLLDIGLPDGLGYDLVPGIKARTRAKALIISTFGDRDTVVKAIMAGADGYLLKDSSPQVILDGIAATLDGGAPVSPAAAIYLLGFLRTEPNPRCRFIPRADCHCARPSCSRPLPAAKATSRPRGHWAFRHTRSARTSSRFIESSRSTRAARPFARPSGRARADPTAAPAYPNAKGPPGWRALCELLSWLREQDLNLRPSGYEPDELPGCSIPRHQEGCFDAARSDLFCRIACGRSGGGLLHPAPPSCAPVWGRWP